MIKVQIGETLFFCDNAQDAADIANLMGGKNGSLRGGSIQNATTRKAQELPNDHGEMVNFIHKINSLPSTLVSSDTLSSALNLESVNGLGPKMRGLSRRFAAAYQIPLEEILTREGRPGQPIFWRVNKGKIENLELN